MSGSVSINPVMAMCTQSVGVAIRQGNGVGVAYGGDRCGEEEPEEDEKEDGGAERGAVDGPQAAGPDGKEDDERGQIERLAVDAGDEEAVFELLVDEQGNEHVIEKERVSLCRCGASKDQPFCDKTHRSIGFEAPGGTLRVKQDTQRG